MKLYEAFFVAKGFHIAFLAFRGNYSIGAAMEATEFGHSLFYGSHVVYWNVIRLVRREWREIVSFLVSWRTQSRSLT